MKRLPLLFLALIALTIGFAVHSVRNPATQASPQIDATKQAGQSSRSRSLTDTQKQISALTKNLNSTGGNEAWFRWLAFLENASLSDLPHYVEQAGNDSIALSLIAERWVALNPQDCFQYLLTLRESGDFSHDDSPGNVFSKLVLTKWAQQDLEAAIMALDHSDSLVGLNKLRKVVLDVVLTTDVRRALALGNRWQSFRSGDPIPPQLAEWAQRDPRAAVSAAFQIASSSYAPQEQPGPFLKPLAEIWAQKSPQNALEFALKKGEDRGYQFADLVFGQWARNDLTAASRWLSGVSDQQAEYFMPTFIKFWGGTDPVAALDWSQESLSGRLLSKSIQKIMSASASVKDVSPRDLLARIESPEVHHQAVLALAHQLWGHIRCGPGDPKALEKISWFADVDNPRTLNQIFLQLSGPWAQADPEGFRTFLASPRAQEVSPTFFGSAMYSLANDNPKQTMNFVSGLPDRLIPSASASAFSVWYNKSTDEAVAWAEELSINDPRRPHLVAKIGGVFNHSHEQSVAELNSMPPIMKTLYRDYMTSLQQKDSEMIDKNGTKVNFSKLLEDTAD